MDQNAKHKKIKGKEEDKQISSEKPSSALLELVDDCLLLIFAKLTLLQAFKLGSSCRQLYSLYQKALLVRPSLALEFRRSGMFFKKDFAAKSTPFPLFSATDYLILPNDAPIAHHLFARLPNLVSLEIRDVGKLAIFALINSLNTSLSKLQSLKLHFYFCYSPVITAEVQQLQLPLLKQLALCIEDNTNPPSKVKDLLKTFLQSRIFDSVFPQLTTFYFFANCRYIADAFRFINHLVPLNPQLLAAANRGGSEHLQIGLHVCVEYEQFCKQVEKGTLPNKATGGLALVTFIELNNSPIVRNPEVFLIQLLKLMPNVKRASFAFWDIDSEENFSYPLVLTGLATTLLHLEEFELDFPQYSPIIPFDYSEMPVMPSVQSFTLKFSSAFHADPVEFLQLAYCFPGLKQISVTIRQDECNYCQYSLDNHADQSTAVFQCCGLNLARKLLRLGETGTGFGITAWESAVKVKKVKVGNFTSLANLVAGISSD